MENDIHSWQLSRLNHCLNYRVAMGNVPCDLINLCDYLQDKYNLELATAPDYCLYLYRLLHPDENCFTKPWHLLPEELGTARMFLYNIIDSVSDLIGGNEANARIFAPQAVESVIISGKELQQLKNTFPDLNALIVASTIASCQQFRITSEAELIDHFLSLSTYQELLNDPLAELLQLACYELN